MRKIASISPVVMLLIFILATFDSIAKEKRLQFTNGIDTINNTKIEKLWPLGKDPAKELELGRRTLNFFVGIRNDTIFVLSETPKLFYNDMYEFDTLSDMVDAFPNADVSSICDIPDDSPFVFYVLKSYGDKTYGDKFNLLGYTSKTVGDFTIRGGIICDNTIFTISKKCKIGTSVQDLFEFLGLTLLDIDVSDKWEKDECTLIINSEYKEIGSPMNKLGGGPINGGSQVCIYIRKGKVAMIRIGYCPILDYEKLSTLPLPYNRSNGEIYDMYYYYYDDNWGIELNRF